MYNKSHSCISRSNKKFQNLDCQNLYMKYLMKKKLESTAKEITISSVN